MPIGKIVAEAASKAVGTIMDGLDGLISSKEELKTIKADMHKVISESLDNITSYQKDIIVAEASGSKLQRNWRPILALSFGFIVISTYFLFPIINIWADNEDLRNLISDLKDNRGFWVLMELMIGGYVVSRGVEKVADTVMRNDTVKKRGLFRRKDKEE